ncbi:MAG TPA: DUF1549 domain-containing protein [Tepidisphaeraceae bacterium]|jgi:hypothetical protein|nr:DUF1549 domain-containing protein [Tepidisphaeraceae bacterium]
MGNAPARRGLAIFGICTAVVIGLVARAHSAATPAASSRESGSYEWRKWEHFWSFEPIARPTPPTVAGTGWVRNPVDAFILAHLQARGISPAPEADKATLIRRATYDLLGLPPTAQELRNFLADKSPDAYESLIDRLLASPHYGEKWGRHWLDVVRYTPGRIAFPGVKHTAGDSHYRDYVVRALNEDKPYDQFVTEQLAGDLLAPSSDRQQEYDQITAPAFLSIGPWFDMCTDPNRLKLEMIDDMIGATGKTFLGLSFQCARCHDHKFDPIPTADYYALAGIFGSTRIVGDFSEYWRDGRVRLLRPLAMPDEVAANDRIRVQIDEKKTAQWKYLTDRHAELLARWQLDEPRYRAAAATVARPYIRNFEAEDFDGVYNLRVAELSFEGKVVQVIETLNPTMQWVRYKFEVPTSGRYRLEAFFSADEKSPLAVQVNGTNVTEDALDATTGGWGLAYRRWEPMATFDLKAGLNFLRMTRKEGSFPRIDKFRLYGADDQFDSSVERTAKERNLQPAVLANFIKDPDHPWPTAPGIIPFLDDAQRRIVGSMDADMERLAAQIAPQPLVVAVNDQPKPGDMPIHLRGGVDAVAKELTPRNCPRLLDHLIPRPVISPGESGRLELARWIVDPRNPLTARVMANRIWQWHFGRGLVETASDFGSRGSPPTHPQLLDWLAGHFVDQGWSMKKLNRLILLSSAYRMSGAADPATIAADPDNRELSRFSPRRLEAEELFDSMFSSTNILLRQESGKPLDVKKSLGRAMYVLTTNRAPPGLGPEVRKMLTLFDLDMTGATVDRRPSSNTAAQSLFWLNSPLPRYYAGKFADRLLKMDKLDDEKRLDQAYWIAFGHHADKRIGRVTLDYLDQLQSQGMSRQDAWTRVCQAMYASDEFHYIQ